MRLKYHLQGVRTTSIFFDSLKSLAWARLNWIFPSHFDTHGSNTGAWVLKTLAGFSQLERNADVVLEWKRGDGEDRGKHQWEAASYRHHRTQDPAAVHPRLLRTRQRTTSQLVASKSCVWRSLCHTETQEWKSAISSWGVVQEAEF